MFNWFKSSRDRLLGGKRRSQTVRRQPRRLPLIVELLEERLAPAVYTVNSAADTGQGNGLLGDLRYCITQANVNAGSTINFAIQNVQTIKLTDTLTIKKPMTIDGYSQLGARVNFLQTGDNAVLKIVIDGGPNTVATAFDIQAGNVTIRGLDIVNFQTNAITITGGMGVTNDKIAGNFIGVDTTGRTAAANLENGITLSEVTQATIGGTTPAERNIISGNGTLAPTSGIWIDKGGNNVVQGNYIGTDSTGTKKLGNGGPGILIYNSSDNQIGVGHMGNVISGNATDGVHIAGENSVDNILQSNFIGTDATGAVALSNTGDGVQISGASGTKVGIGDPDPSKAKGNLISGNGNFGVEISVSGTTQNYVSANSIGTDVSRTNPLGNIKGGVSVNGDTNFIGSGTLGDGNVISGNGDPNDPANPLSPRHHHRGQQQSGPRQHHRPRRQQDHCAAESR